MKSSERTVIVAGLLLVAGWLANRFPPAHLASQLAYVGATIVAGLPIARRAWGALRFRVIGIDLLVTLAAIGAILIGEYWEAGVVTFLFIFGAYLEARTMAKTRDAIQKLIRLAPKTAHVRRISSEGAPVELEIPAGEVRLGEMVVVRPGETIPVDGRVLAGRASVNTASVTGESLPVEVTAGSRVLSGAVNEEGYLEISAERVGADTTFERIINLVEEAQEAKVPVQRFLEKFARYYTPGIILLAVAAYLFTRDLRMALTLLVIACPGALVMAAPVAVVAGIGTAAGHGVLIKGGEHLEKVGRVTALALDKTGTLTQGKLKVVRTVGWGQDPDQVLKMAAVVEHGSEHPIARAVLAAAAELPGPPEPQRLDGFHTVPGQGVVASIGEKTILVGNPRLFAGQNLTLPPAVLSHLKAEEELGRTVMLVGQDDHVIGAISAADVIRPEASRLVGGLEKAGVRNLVILTGDNPQAARHVAAQAGVTEVKAQLLPEDKVEVIKEIRGRGEVVAMVGDGLNDAPALAFADVSIAMGAAGSDVAVESADIALMSDRLDRIPFAIGLGKATMRVIRQNTVLAVVVVAVLVASVLMGKLELASGMFVHEASVMAVILNGMRLLRYSAAFPVSG
ncbi:MAG: heavy metal translocating P-type ATPase [Syntrophothermus sp.]